MDLPNISDYHDYSDDLFDEVIEIDHGFTESERFDDDDGDIDVNKENKHRSAKATKLQFEKIDQFTKEHNATLIEVKEFNKLWEKLAGELNSLGPPSFTVSQWRFKWSQHKYNKKRNLANDAKQIAEPSYQEKQSHGILTSDAVQRVVLTSHETSNINAEISEKLTVIIQKEDAILKAIDRGNNLLEEIARNTRPF